MIVVKAGGSAITDKGKYATARPRIIRSLASELSSAQEEIILVCGAGSFGHIVAKRHGLAEGYVRESQKKGVAQTRHDVSRLNAMVTEALIQKKILAVSMPPRACFVCEGGRIKESFLEPVRMMSETGFVPVLFGDIVSDMYTGFCILSGDRIAAYLAHALGAHRLILATDVDGFYDGDPKKKKGATLLGRIRYAELSGILSHASEVGDVTGGMAGKLREILTLKGEGIETDIINLTKRGVLSSALRGEVRGTRIVG